MTWPFGRLKRRHYRVILADPPWRFKTFNDDDQRKKPERHYRTMSLAELQDFPVAALAHPESAALVMWTTSPMLAKGTAHQLMHAWGFEGKAVGTWAKQSRSGSSLAFGTGYIFRNASEFYMVGTIGTPRLNKTRAARSVRNLILAPLREHSRKPDQLHADIEALWEPPWCELFARARRPGWDCWGNELGKFQPKEESNG